MFDEALTLLSIWPSMFNWLTPTVFFLLLNLIIGTIFITSGVTSHKPHHQHHHDAAVNLHGHHHQPQQPPQITRAPLVLQRLKSINFYSYCSHTPSSTPLVHQQIIPPQVHVPQQQQQSSSSVPDPLPKTKPERGLPKAPVRVSFQTQVRTQTQTRVLGEETLPQSRTPAQAKAQALAQAQARTQAQTQTHTPNLDEGIMAHTRTQTQTPVLEEDNVDGEGPTLDEIYSRIKGTSSVHYNRQNSDTKPVGGEIPVKLPAKIKKSASDKSAFNHFQAVEEDENVAPPMVEKEKVAAAAATGGGGGGTEVDARADDFINKFKKQLQLQKMESIVRYKEMISRGSGE